jgi:hypothetical protein
VEQIDAGIRGKAGRTAVILCRKVTARFANAMWIIFIVETPTTAMISTTYDEILDSNLTLQLWYRKRERAYL